MAEHIPVRVYAIQKLIRDIGLVWDIQAINYGAVWLGRDCPDGRT